MLDISEQFMTVGIAHELNEKIWWREGVFLAAMKKGRGRRGC